MKGPSAARREAARPSCSSWTWKSLGGPRTTLTATASRLETEEGASAGNGRLSSERQRGRDAA
eukprot:scaffold241977_cov28-Tisochrysis_lutea.AAC.1